MAESLETTEADFKGFDPQRLYKGEKINNWPEGVAFYATNKQNWTRVDDVLMNSFADRTTFRAYLFPIYSRRLQDALLSAGIGDLQFLPCRVRDGRGCDISGHAMANVLTFRDALDHRESKVYYRDNTILPRPNVSGNVSAIITAALFANRIQNCDLFRLPEDPRELFVSDRFRIIYRKLKATGISFDECRVQP